jgi:DNA-binding transcriptional regulator GbsR (MarR family)
MSLERVKQALVNLGLSRVDAEVYVHIAKKGPIPIGPLADVLKFSKQKLNPSLKNLQSKGIVTVSFEDKPFFSSLPFEKTIELLIEIKIEQAQVMQETKEELLSSWRKMIEDQSEKS